MRQKDADFLSALKFSHLSGVKFVGDIQTLEQDCGITFSGVAVFFADDPLEFAEFHAVFVGHVGLGVDGIALLHGGPEALVAHDDGVDSGVGVEGELILT